MNIYVNFFLNYIVHSEFELSEKKVCISTGIIYQNM